MTRKGSAGLLLLFKTLREHRRTPFVIRRMQSGRMQEKPRAWNTALNTAANSANKTAAMRSAC